MERAGVTSVLHYLWHAAIHGYCTRSVDGYTSSSPTPQVLRHQVMESVRPASVTKAMLCEDVLPPIE